MVRKLITEHGLLTYEIFNEQAKEVLVLLHGFSQTSETFYRLATTLKEIKVVAINLLGHGGSDDEEYSFHRQCFLIDQLMAAIAIKKFSIYGYSLGARVAQFYAQYAPHRVKSLWIESGWMSPLTKVERHQRIQFDRKVEEKLALGMEEFITWWEQLPIFDTQKKWNQADRQQDLNMRRQQDAQKLIRAYQAFTMLNDQVFSNAYASFPVYLLAGKEDMKYRTHLAQMALVYQASLALFESGHNIHRVCVKALANYIEKELLVKEK